MSFVDKVSITVAAGKGGDGKLSFRHEKFIRKGGPDGGDGGNGGDIILRASQNQNTLAAFRYQKELKAEDGQAGGKSRKHGKKGSDLITLVPVGTVAIQLDTNKLIADLAEEGAEAIIASGGRGGFGNAHFVSSRRQAPNFAEKGEPGEHFSAHLELKMIADIGLVGLPNAGKSTLLSKLSNARPEIGDYPFTTLAPNLGVVDLEGGSMLVADIPGLIAGAAEGKGLGHDFLRHIERTAVTLHLIDAYQEHIAETYQIVREELKAYQPKLVTRPEVIVINKVEGLDEEIVGDLVRQLRSIVPARTPILVVSAHSGYGLKPLKYELWRRLEKARAAHKPKPKQPAVPIIRLTDTAQAFSITKEGQVFVVHGERIERFARRTDFSNADAVRRLKDIMRRDGILRELVRSGVTADQRVYFGDASGDSLKY